MKECKKCKIKKPRNLFYGVQGECKECTKLRVKENLIKVGSGYDFSEIGVVRVIYKTQKRHNKVRGHGLMPYTKNELSLWLYSKGFKGLYDNWVESGHVSAKKPSVDRIDDFIGYSLSNVRLGTWGENRLHQHQDITNGTGTSGKSCKTLYKYDLLSNLIATYVSYSSAVRDIGYSLEYQIKKKVKCRSGYLWSYSPL